MTTQTETTNGQPTQIIRAGTPAADILTENTHVSLDRLGLAFLDELSGGHLFHTDLFTGLFGYEFYDRYLDRMQATIAFPRWLCMVATDDYLAYALARSAMADRNEALVCSLVPDQAQHTLLHFTAEAAELHQRLADETLHHDPAPYAAFVNTRQDLAKTINVFHRNGIGYHPLLWEDDVRFTQDRIRSIRGGFIVV